MAVSETRCIGFCGSQAFPDFLEIKNATINRQAKESTESNVERQRVASSDDGDVPTLPEEARLILLEEKA